MTKTQMSKTILPNIQTSFTNGGKPHIHIYTLPHAQWVGYVIIPNEVVQFFHQKHK